MASQERSAEDNDPQRAARRWVQFFILHLSHPPPAPPRAGVHQLRCGFLALMGLKSEC